MDQICKIGKKNRAFNYFHWVILHCHKKEEIIAFLSLWVNSVVKNLIVTIFVFKKDTDSG